MAVMERECFWGCVLSKAKPECTWNAGEDDVESEIDINHTLRLSHACLDANIKDTEKERNVVQVTTTDVKDDECTMTIASLRIGLLEQCTLGVNFNAPAKFKLIEGSGPVHLVGNHIQGISEDLLQTGDSSSEDEEEEESPVNILKPKRPPALSEGAPKTKKAKLEEDKDEEESESEEESDEEMEVEKKVPVSAANVKATLKQEQAKPAAKQDMKKNEKIVDDEAEESEEEEEEESEEEESEEEDESEDDEEEEGESEEEESDEDDDSEEEDEDEEMVTALVGKKGKVTPKKPMANGVKPPRKGDNPKTPAKVAAPKPDKKQEKTPAAATPKTDKKQEKTPGKKSAKSPGPPMDINALKEKLSTMKNLPKTPEKFKNFMKGFKVDEESKLKELWTWLEGNRK